MAKSSFGREPKEMTTEPSADEVSHGMKRGGHAHKKHMAMGGNPMMARPAPAMMRRPAAMPMAAPVMRKKGGKAEGGESKAHEKAEMHEMHKIEKELKHHEKQAAHLAHAGLKKGGKVYDPTPGGVLAEGGPHHKGTTGAIEGPGYRKGGHAHKKHHMAAGGTMPMDTKGGAQLKKGGKAHHMMHKAEGGKIDSFEARSALKPKIDVKDKVVGAKQTKSLSTKTGGVEGVGYKHGGKMHKYAKGGTVSDSVASRYVSDMKDGEHMPTKKGGTKSIHQDPAGYKKGGHVTHHGHAEHHKHHKAEGGHVHMHKMHGGDAHGHKHVGAGGGTHAEHGHGHMKHGGHVTSKISTHKKAGGKCNY